MEKRHCWEKIENRERKKKTEYEIRVCEKIERKKAVVICWLFILNIGAMLSTNCIPVTYLAREDSTHHFISFLLSLLNSRYHWSSTGGGYSIIYFIDFFLSILHSEYKLFQPRKDQTCITVHATDFGSVDNKITGKLSKLVSITSNIFDKRCA
jgi:hypothetical protein